MEVLRSEDLDADFAQPEQPGWSSQSTPSSGSSGSGAPTELSSSLDALLQSSLCYGPGDPGRILLEHHRSFKQAQAYLSGDIPSRAAAE